MLQEDGEREDKLTRLSQASHQVQCRSLNNERETDDKYDKCVQIQ